MFADTMVAAVRRPMELPVLRITSGGMKYHGCWIEDLAQEAAFPLMFRQPVAE
jgi:hypothetical protein